MTTTFLIAISVGTLAMAVLLAVGGKTYKIKTWKNVPIAVLLCACGILGAKIMFFVENGFWGGNSFFGAILLIPLLFWIAALIFCIPYPQLLDICAPAECVMLVLLKINCYLEKCCYGFVMYRTASFETVRFPSQIVEAVNGLLIMILLMRVIRRKQHIGEIYPLFLIVYGASRFILNFFRGDTTAFVWILPAGHFWGLVSVAIGGLALFGIRKMRKERAYEDEKESVI